MCILVNTQTVKSVSVALACAYDAIELVAIDVLSAGGKFRLAVCYRPPSSSDRDNASLAYTSLLCNCIESIYPANSTFVLCGDLNFPKINWSNNNHVLSDSTTCSGIFLSMYFKLSFVQFVEDATRYAFQNSRNGSVLDVVFSNDSNFVHNVDVVEPFGTSDHCIVNFDVVSDVVTEPCDEQFFDFNHADWDSIRNFLDSVDFFTLFSNTVNSEDIVAKFYSIINNCIERFVPLRCRKVNSGYVAAHYPARIRKLLRKKLQSWRIYCRFRTVESRLHYCRVASECRSAIYFYHSQREANIIDSGNVNKFFNYANRKFKCKSSVGPLRQPDGTITVDPRRKADLLQHVFSSKYVNDNGTLPSIAPRVTSDKLNSVYFSSYSVKKAIKKLKAKSCGGPDNVPPHFIKQCVDQLCVPLAFVFNSCLDQGYLPPVWLSANVTPVFKKGDPTDPQNYRPIALTCTICKVMESVIKQHLLTYLLNRHLITRHQHGFLNNHSTATNLLECTHDWVVALGCSNQVDVVYIDFSRAFDSIVFAKLLLKLQSYGVDGKLLQWIGAFLSPRVQRVVVEGRCSFVANVRSGVPQGSVLGPVLFLVYINDVTDICSGGVQLKLFADDLKLYTAIDSIQCANNLQSTIDRLSVWSTDWQLNINISKCNSLTLHRPRKTPTLNVYSIAGSPIPSSTSVSDLGVQFSSDLSYHSEISNIVSKASRRVGVFFRGFCSNNLTLARKVWLTYIRPLLEYNSCIWNPSHIYLIDQLERVQRQFTKRIRCISHLSYLERLAVLGLEPLELRRLRSDLLFYYKIINDLTILPSNIYFNFRRRLSSIRVSSPQLVKPTTGSRSEFDSFFYRVIDCYNSLHPDVRHSVNPNSFYHNLLSADLSQFLIGSAFNV